MRTRLFILLPEARAWRLINREVIYINVFDLVANIPKT